MNVIFFGSTADSVLVLEALNGFRLRAVVTQPPRPVGRDKIVTPTPVELWAKEHSITHLSFPSDPDKPWLYKNEDQVIDTLDVLKADIVISACYGQKIPWETIRRARLGGLNVHPSLLPRWRGADPVPWAILSGDHQTGVSVVTLSKNFDEGAIIAQKKIPIMDTDASDPLRTKLFTIGADLLMKVLLEYVLTPPKPPLNPSSPPLKVRGGRVGLPYARRLTREDGFEPWEAMQKATQDPEEAKRIDRKFRAFHPWPGLWSKIGDKRLKILRITHNASRITLETVQLEGKKPVSWQQFEQAYSSLLTLPHNPLH